MLCRVLTSCALVITVQSLLLAPPIYHAVTRFPACFDCLNKMTPLELPGIIGSVKFENGFFGSAVIELTFSKDQTLTAIMSVAPFEPHVTIPSEDFYLEDVDPLGPTYVELSQLAEGGLKCAEAVVLHGA